MIYKKGDNSYIQLNENSPPFEIEIVGCDGKIQYCYFEGSIVPSGMTGPEEIVVRTKKGKELTIKSSCLVTPAEVPLRLRELSDMV